MPSTARPAVPAVRRSAASGPRQLGARQAEIAQRVVEDLLAFGGQRRVFGACGDRLVLLVQREVLADARPEFGHARQVLAVGGPQFGRIGNRVQVADDAPRATERLRRLLDRLDDGCPGCRRRGRACRLDRTVGVIEQRVERGRHVFRADLAEAGQAREIEQRVGVGAGGHKTPVCCRMNRSERGKARKATRRPISTLLGRIARFPIVSF